MVISETLASEFIRDYSHLMAEIYGPLPKRSNLKLLNVLAAGRQKYVADRSLLDVALNRLNGSVSPEVVSAVRSLELKKWVFLRDTRSHSIFVEPSGTVAYGVLGLTERFRNVVGGSGAVVETGLVQYAGHYVKDGLVSNVVWLGKNYKQSYSTLLTRLRKEGAFHTTYAP